MGLRSWLIVSYGGAVAVAVAIGVLAGIILGDKNPKGSANPDALTPNRILEDLRRDANPNIYAPRQPFNDLKAIFDERYEDAFGTDKLSKALREAKRAVEMAKSNYGEDDSRYAAALDELARLQREKKRLPQAEALYRQAIAILEKNGADNHPALSGSQNGLARVLRDSGRWADAEALYRSALAIDERNEGPEHPLVARDLSNLAQLLQNAERLAEAESLLLRALAIAEKAGPEHAGVAIALSNLGKLLQKADRSAEAEPLLRRALGIDEKRHGPEHAKVAVDLINLADVRAGLGHSAEAAQLHGRARRIVSIAGGQAWQNDLLVQAVTASSSSLRLALSGAYDASATGPEARQNAFDRAQWVMQSAAADALTRMSARFAKGDGALAGLARELQDLDALLQNGQRLLNMGADALDENSVEEIRRLVATVQQRHNALNARLRTDFEGYLLLVGSDRPTIADIRALLKHDEVLVVFLDMPKIQTQPEETLVWVISKDQDSWYSVPLSTQTLQERVAALRCGLDDEEWSGATKAAQCAERLERTDAVGDGEPLPFHLGIAHELYRSLFGPVDGLIKGKRLLIVPSGPLTSLPFHVLVTQKPDILLPTTFEGFRNVAWLGRSHAITVLPSVTSLKALRVQSAKRPQAPADYIGIGNPILAGTPGECRDTKLLDRCPTVEIAGARPQLTVATAERGTIRGGGGRNAGKGLDEIYRRGGDAAVLIRQVRALCPLPDTDYELRCVAELFPPGRYDLLRDKLATESDLKRLSADGTLARYRIVHFATHGLVAGDLGTMAKQRGEPALVLTPPDQPVDVDDDGLLTASEVAQLRLNADWVVLSACSTAAGDGTNAEALSGLATAFFYAGTRALLVSHWPVYSDAAVRLTTRTFAELDHDPEIGRAEAFRRAMLALMDDPSLASNAHPSVWAPFVVVGEGAR